MNREDMKTELMNLIARNGDLYIQRLLEYAVALEKAFYTK